MFYKIWGPQFSNTCPAQSETHQKGSTQQPAPQRAPLWQAKAKPAVLSNERNGEQLGQWWMGAGVFDGEIWVESLRYVMYALGIYGNMLICSNTQEDRTSRRSYQN